MRTDNAMKTLNAARRAIGLSGQGISCSPVVIQRTLTQLEREIGNDALPQTVSLLNEMKANNGLASERAAMISMNEINTVREKVRATLRLQEGADLTDEPDADAPRAN